MVRRGFILILAFAAALALTPPAHAQRSAYAERVKAHAAANNVPESLVHRVIMRESKYQANLIGRGNTIGLMQIKVATARGVGYHGDAAGLRDPETNLTYGIRYLAGAYRVAHGNHDRAVSLYARGYYYDEKRAGLPPMRFAAVPRPAPAQTSDTADAASNQPAETAAIEQPPARAPGRIAHVPLPRARPQFASADTSQPVPAIPAQPILTDASASAERPAEPPQEPWRAPAPRREQPGTLAKIWNDLTAWARR